MRTLLALLLVLLPLVGHAQSGAALPSGYLSVSGNQIQDGSGNNLRIAATTYRGTPADTTTMPAIRAAGFNTIVIGWRDALLTGTAGTGCNTLADIDLCVSHAQTAGLKVILSHRGNQAPVGACASIQQNGLWFDKDPVAGGDSGNADGCGTAGTITYATFKANTVSLLQRYANNSTVIGYELHHAPLINGAFTGQANGSTGSPGSFTVASGVIKDPGGNTWLARGLNIYDSQAISGNASVAQAQALFPHLNFVRFALGSDNCMASDFALCNGSGGAVPTIAQIETAVSSFTAKGIVMMVDPHIGGGSQDASSMNLYNEAKLLGQIAADKKADPYVWFESGNELNAAGMTAEHQNVYYSVRNAGAPWTANTAFPAHAIRNNAGNLYIQTVGAAGPNRCTSGSSGPTGTGTGIVDGSCRWDFIKTNTASASGGSNALVVLCPPNGGNPGAQPDGPLSAYNLMTGILIDQHRYNWSVYAFYGRGNGQTISQSESDAEWLSTVNFQKSVYVPDSTEGTVAVIAGETGYIDYVGGDQNNCINCNSSYTVVDSALRMTGGASGFAQWFWHWDGGQPSTDATVQDGTTRTVNGNNTNTVGIAPGPAPSPVTGGGINAAINWGGGGDTDIRAACGDVGAAVNAVNSGVILFCPAPLNNASALLSGASKP